MKLEQLNYIVEIAKTRSLSRAAKNLYISQPAMTAAINNLETELGVKLFQRTNLGAFPTAKGMEIINVATRSLEELKQIDQILGKEETEQQEVRVVSMPVISATVLLDAAVEFYGRYPCITLVNDDARSERIPLLLSEKAYDIGLYGFFDDQLEEFQQQIKRLNLHAELVCNDFMQILVYAEHPFAQRKLIPRKEIGTERLIMFTEVWNERKDEWVTEGIHPIYRNDTTGGCIAVDSLECINRMVASNLGISILPNTIAYRNIYLELGRIVSVPIENAANISHYILYPEGQKLSGKTEEFIRMLRRAYGSLFA